MTRNNEDRLSSDVIMTFKQYIHSHIKDDEFRYLFLDFFKKDYSLQVFPSNHRYLTHKYFERILITVFKDYTIDLLSWKQYCLSMKTINIQTWIESDSTDFKRVKRIARKMLSDFFQYAVSKRPILNTF